MLDQSICCPMLSSNPALASLVLPLSAHLARKAAFGQWCNHNYTSPSGKWTEEMRSALAPELRPMLDWELPDDSDGQDIRGVARL
jgi:hypothetical protein